MATITTGNIFRIFLASPGDLADERKTTQKIIDEVNQIISRSKTGWHIELLGWEDTLPGMGRPQAIINPDVDRCNLFIGLLWRRWGTETGEFSSGFEEEFSRAQDRSLKSQEPEIWLFFKNVDQYELDDPGDQLQKTISFQSRIQQSRQLLYKKFKDCTEWETMLRNSLLEYIFPLILEHNQTQNQGSVSISKSNIVDTRTPIAHQLENTETQPDISNQALQVIDRARNAIVDGSLESAPSWRIGRTDIARFYLIAASWMMEYTSEILGIHETNLLFSFRKDFDLQNQEMLLLHRTLIADTQSLKPGWFWLHKINMMVEGHINTLFVMISDDTNSFVRRCVLEVLSLNNINPPAYIEKAEFFKSIFSDEAEEVVKAGLGYFGSIAKKDELSLLDDLIKDHNKYHVEARLAKISILSKHKLVNKAFKIVLKNLGAKSDKWYGLLFTHSETINKELLEEGINHEDKIVRFFSVKALSKRHELNILIAKTLTQDSWAPIKYIAFETLIQNEIDVKPEEIREAFKDSGYSYSSLPKEDLKADSKELLFELYSKYSKEELTELLNWFSLDINIIYKALIYKYYNSYGNQFADDVQTNFETLKKESTRKMVEKFGDEATNTVVKQFSEIDDFRTELLVSAAIFVINQHDAKEHIEFVRKHLALCKYNHDLHYQAIEFLSKFGDQSDVDLLAQIAKQRYGAIKLQASKAAIALSANKSEIVKDFLNSDDKGLIRSAIEGIISHSLFDLDEFLIPLLRSSQDFTRLAAIYYFTNKLSLEKLSKLLDDYLSEQAYYYYNVVVWLDRALFAPEPLRQGYLKNLKREFEDT